MNKEFDQLLDGTVVGSLATTLADGQPWCTPLHLVFDEDNVYWLSKADTVHSRNVAERPHVSLAIWSDDLSKGLKGIYIQSQARALSGEDAKAALGYYANTLGIDVSRLHSETVYTAKIGVKNTSLSRGDRRYFDSDKAL